MKAYAVYNITKDKVMTNANNRPMIYLNKQTAESQKTLKQLSYPYLQDDIVVKVLTEED